MINVEIHTLQLTCQSISDRSSQFWILREDKNNFSLIKKFLLSQNMRTLPKEANFAEFLLDVGDGVLNDDDNNFIIPHSYLAIADSDIVDDIYGNFIREKR